MLLVIKFDCCFCQEIITRIKNFKKNCTQRIKGSYVYVYSRKVIGIKCEILGKNCTLRIHFALVLSLIITMKMKDTSNICVFFIRRKDLPH